MKEKKTLIQARIRATVAEDFSDFLTNNYLNRAVVIEKALEKFMDEYGRAGNRVPKPQMAGRVAHPNTEGYKIPPAPVQPESVSLEGFDFAVEPDLDGGE